MDTMNLQSIPDELQSTVQQHGKDETIQLLQDLLEKNPEFFYNGSKQREMVMNDINTLRNFDDQTDSGTSSTDDDSKSRFFI